MRARLAHQGTSLHKVLEGLADILVVDVELIFKRIQFRLIVNLPPLSAKSRVLRLRDGPSIGLIELRRRLLEGRRRRHRGRKILRPDIASCQHRTEHSDDECGQSP